MTSVKKLSFIAAITLLSACTVVEQTKAPVKLTEKQLTEAFHQRHSTHLVSIKDGTPILQVIQLVKNSGVPIMASPAMDLSDLRYTGPDLLNMNIMDALQVVTGLTVLDYKLHPRSGLITIVPAHFHKMTLPKTMQEADWDVLLAATNKASSVNYVDKNGVSRALNIAKVIEDKADSTIRIAGPLHTRNKIVAIISSYAQQLNDPDAIGVVAGKGAIVVPSKIPARVFGADEVVPGDNVEIGVLAPPPRFN